MINVYGGDISNDDLKLYFKRLINKIFKLLPLKEEGCGTLEQYFDSLMLELCGGEELFYHHEMFLELIFNLYSLKDLEEIKLYRSQVFKCINICQNICNKLEVNH